ncbi:tetratricopeptide repeat protein [Endothiovibrio diazotrophicus]
MIKPTLIAAALALTVGTANAADFNQELDAVQHDWAIANYRTDKAQQETAFKKLINESEAFEAAYPRRAEPKIWHGIILSSYAGVIGGLGALDQVKQARDLLLEAEKIDPTALDGSAYTSLGSLYYKVPGWPIGFGDGDKAQEYLKKALQQNPDGIDPNYFYGDYLLEEGEYKEAVVALKKALDAPARPKQPVADQGRRKEIQVALAKAKEKAEGGSGW